MSRRYDSVCCRTVESLITDAGLDDALKSFLQLSSLSRIFSAEDDGPEVALESI